MSSWLLFRIDPLNEESILRPAHPQLKGGFIHTANRMKNLLQRSLILRKRGRFQGEAATISLSINSMGSASLSSPQTGLEFLSLSLSLPFTLCLSLSIYPRLKAYCTASWPQPTQEGKVDICLAHLHAVLVWQLVTPVNSAQSGKLKPCIDNSIMT